MLKNKKAQVSELMQDTACLIVIALLLIIFFTVSGNIWNLSKEKTVNTMEAGSFKNQAHYSLYAFLQKPVNIKINSQMQTITTADLIRLNETAPANQFYKTALNLEIQALENYYAPIFKTKTKFNLAYKNALVKAGYSYFYIPSASAAPVLVILQLNEK